MNKDGVITDDERKDFNLQVLKNKNVLFVGDGMGLTNYSVHYQDETKLMISYKDLTKWLEEYNPEE